MGGSWWWEDSHEELMQEIRDSVVLGALEVEHNSGMHQEQGNWNGEPPTPIVIGRMGVHTLNSVCWTI